MFKRRFVKKTLRELQNVKLGDYPRFRITGEYFAKVVKVYDGDTITVVFRTEPKQPLYQHSIRMYGYDSPELRPDKNKNYENSRFKNREDEIAQAKKARDYLSNLILDKIVLIKVMPGDDPYKRLLCNVFRYPPDKNNCINAIMIMNGHGYEYYGGTKLN